MTIPASLIEVRDKDAKKRELAMENVNEHWRVQRIASQNFCLGFDKAIAHLQSLGGESDDKALKDRALNYFYERGGTASRDAHGAMGHFEDGALWMHSEMQARVGLADERAKNLHHEMHMQIACIKRQEDKIKALEAELSFVKSMITSVDVRKAYASNPSDSECAGPRDDFYVCKPGQCRQK